MYPPNKSKLVESLGKFSTRDFSVSCSMVKYMLDGRNLINKMGKWTQHQTFKTITGQCALQQTMGKIGLLRFLGNPKHPLQKITHMLRE